MNLLDCEHLLSRDAVASYRLQITPKRGLVCCYHAEGLLPPLFKLRARLTVCMEKKQMDDCSMGWLPLLPSYVTALRTLVLVH